MKYCNSYLYLSSITKVFVEATESDICDEWCFMINEDYRPSLKNIKRYIEGVYYKRFSAPNSHVIICTPVISNISRIDEDLATMLFEEKDIIKYNKNENS